jgi:glycerate 2-kinase
MKIIIAPGAFKDSLSANRVAQAITRGLQRSGLDYELFVMPIADGGNGTLDAFLSQGGRRIACNVLNPVEKPIDAEYALLDDGNTAVIEMALASGMELISADEQNPLKTTTYGTGQLLSAALDTGAKRIVIGMGGSATVDGGAGCLQALGVRLLDADGNDVSCGGGQLSKIAQIDSSALDSRWRDVEIIIASDVDNPTLGPNGAAAIFGPQKGASPQDVDILEANLRHFFTLIRDQLGIDVLDVRGGGAAGAFAAGLMAFLGGRIESGIDLILEHMDFEKNLQNAALVITGEGQIDEQTIQGKGPIGVARLAREYGVPTVAIVGGLNADDELLHNAGVQAVLPIVTGTMTLAEAIYRADELVERTALRLGYLLQVK